MYTTQECEVLRLHTAYLKTLFRNSILPRDAQREALRLLDEGMDVAESHTDKPEAVQ